MKSTIRIALCLALVCLLGSCGSEANTSANPPAPTGNSFAPDTVVDRVILTAGDTPQYNREHFTVAAGSTIELTLRHTGSMGKETTGHNVVILTLDSNPESFAKAARQNGSSGYIPPNAGDQLIAHTRMLGGGESDTIRFTAPAEPGDYTYLCSFPGHYQLGMAGTMSVL